MEASRKGRRRFSQRFQRKPDLPPPALDDRQTAERNEETRPIFHRQEKTPFHGGLSSTSCGPSSSSSSCGDWLVGHAQSVEHDSTRPVSSSSGVSQSDTALLEPAWASADSSSSQQDLCSPEQVRLTQQREGSFLATPVEVSSVFMSAGGKSRVDSDFRRCSDPLPVPLPSESVENLQSVENLEDAVVRQRILEHEEDDVTLVTERLNEQDVGSGVSSKQAENSFSFDIELPTISEAPALLPHSRPVKSKLFDSRPTNDSNDIVTEDGAISKSLRSSNAVSKKLGVGPSNTDENEKGASVISHSDLKAIKLSLKARAQIRLSLKTNAPTPEADDDITQRTETNDEKDFTESVPRPDDKAPIECKSSDEKVAECSLPVHSSANVSCSGHSGDSACSFASHDARSECVDVVMNNSLPSELFVSAPEPSVSSANEVVESKRLRSSNKARKQRRRSAFGSELCLKLETVEENEPDKREDCIASENIECKDSGDDRLVLSNDAADETRVPTGVTVSKEFSHENLSHAKSTAPVVTIALSDNREATQSLQLTSEMIAGRRTGAQETDSEFPELAGLDEKQREEAKHILEDLDLDEPVPAPPPKRKRKRRMSADLAIMMENEKPASDGLLEDPAAAQPEGESSGISTRSRRSSLRLYRRQSHKFVFTASVNDDAGEDEEGRQAVAGVPNTTTSCTSSVGDVNVSTPAQLQPEASGGQGAEREGDAGLEDVPADLQDLYKNKNYKAPPDKTWETIFEVPSKGKVTSKQKLKRYLQFEDNVPVAKLRRRLKRAAQNGWDADVKWQQEQFSEFDVRIKLRKLDEEINSDTGTA